MRCLNRHSPSLCEGRIWYSFIYRALWTKLWYGYASRVVMLARSFCKSSPYTSTATIARSSVWRYEAMIVCFLARSSCLIWNLHSWKSNWPLSHCESKGLFLNHAELFPRSSRVIEIHDCCNSKSFWLMTLASFLNLILFFSFVGLPSKYVFST